MASGKVTFGQYIPMSEHMSIIKGIYTRTKQEIIIKEYTRFKIAELAPYLTEQFCQAKLHHPYICNIIDVLLDESEAGFKLNLCLEKLEGTLQGEIENRALRGEWYSEEELWRFLQGTGEALAQAQRLVSGT